MVAYILSMWILFGSLLTTVTATMNTSKEDCGCHGQEMVYILSSFMDYDAQSYSNYTPMCWSSKCVVDAALLEVDLFQPRYLGRV